MELLLPGGKRSFLTFPPSLQSKLFSLRNSKRLNEEFGGKIKFTLQMKEE
jgi:hypothetical protein